MRAVLDPSIPTVQRQAFLYQEDKLVASAWHACVEQEGGGFHPADDICFEINVSTKPTKAVVCGQTLTITRAFYLSPTDTFRIEIVAHVRQLDRWTPHDIT